jgi:hypothetical protein
VGSIIDTLGFIAGVPRLLVPDQPRALIANPDAYEPVTSSRSLTSSPTRVIGCPQSAVAQVVSSGSWWCSTRRR